MFITISTLINRTRVRSLMKEKIKLVASLVIGSHLLIYLGSQFLKNSSREEFKSSAISGQTSTIQQDDHRRRWNN